MDLFFVKPLTFKKNKNSFRYQPLVVILENNMFSNFKLVKHLKMEGGELFLQARNV